MGLASEPFAELADRVGAKAPTPGGGAVVGLCGTLAASLACMVTRYSQGRDGQEANQPAYAETLEEIEKAALMLLQLAEEDMRAYERLSDVMKRPKGDPERDSAMPEAVRGAVTPPMSVMGLCLALLRRYEALAPIANQWLLSDLAIATELTGACGLASAHLVRANASLLATHAPGDGSLDEAERMATQIGELRASALARCAGGSN